MGARNHRVYTRYM